MLPEDIDYIGPLGIYLEKQHNSSYIGCLTTSFL